MTDRNESKGKSIQEHVEEFFEEMREALEGFLSPAPALVPVPVRVHSPRRPHRR
jgi:hypothetical protein